MGAATGKPAQETAGCPACLDVCDTPHLWDCAAPQIIEVGRSDRERLKRTVEHLHEHCLAVGSAGLMSHVDAEFVGRLVPSRERSTTGCSLTVLR